MTERERGWILHLAQRRRLSPWMHAFVEDMVRRAFLPDPPPLTERQRLVLKREVGAKPA